MRPHGLYSPLNSPGHNTGVGFLSLLQGIFPTQGSNPGLLYCRWILYQLSHKESPRILEWVAYPFSRGSSPPRNQTRVSCIASGFFTNWAMREAHADSQIRAQFSITLGLVPHWTIQAGETPWGQSLSLFIFSCLFLCLYHQALYWSYSRCSKDIKSIMESMNKYLQVVDSSPIVTF